VSQGSFQEKQRAVKKTAAREPRGVSAQKTSRFGVGRRISKCWDSNFRSETTKREVVGGKKKKKKKSESGGKARGRDALPAGTEFSRNTRISKRRVRKPKVSGEKASK